MISYWLHSAGGLSPWVCCLSPQFYSSKHSFILVNLSRPWWQSYLHWTSYSWASCWSWTERSSSPSLRSSPSPSLLVDYSSCNRSSISWYPPRSRCPPSSLLPAVRFCRCSARYSIAVWKKWEFHLLLSRKRRGVGKSQSIFCARRSSSKWGSRGSRTGFFCCSEEEVGF